MGTFITSDWHFYHKNICGEEGFETKTRGHFKSVDEMNDEIIKNINQNTSPDDTIIHLGDVGLGSPTKMFEVVSRIHCNIIFINGNHDNSKLAKKLVNNGYEVHDVGMRYKQDGKVYLLSHYPLGLGDKRVNIRNLCGHIHGEVAFGWNVLNVGVDSPEIESLNLKFGQPIKIEDAIKLVEEKWENNMRESMTEEDWIRYGGK